MLNDITLSADGLTPSWRLTDEVGTSLTGYDWSAAGISGVGGGSLKYRIIYAAPAGLTQWGIEGRDNLGGAISSATVNLPISTSVNVVIGDALPSINVGIS